MDWLPRDTNEYLSWKHVTGNTSWLNQPQSAIMWSSALNCNRLMYYPGVGRVILDSACLSIHLLACQFICPSFICLTQIIANTRGCVICDEFWPWPLSPRSFGLEQFATKRLKYGTFIHYTTPTVLNRFFPYWLPSSFWYKPHRSS